MNARFARALLDPGQDRPAGLTGPGGAPAGRRFDVYRNNVAVSLTEALGQGFPVVKRLVGAEFFDAMAGIFLRAHPPQSPLLMHYGGGMPAFLETFPPVAHLPYLPDMARLELALRQSYHAADAAPVDPARVTALPPERLPGLRFRFAPALRLIPSAHPVHAIWRANTEAGAPRPETGGQDVVVLRPGFDPAPHPLPPGGGAVLAALMAGATVAAACDAAPDCDIAALFSLLLSGGAITEVEASP